MFSLQMKSLERGAKEFCSTHSSAPGSVLCCFPLVMLMQYRINYSSGFGLFCHSVSSYLK